MFRHDAKSLGSRQINQLEKPKEVLDENLLSNTCSQSILTWKMQVFTILLKYQTKLFSVGPTDRMCV